MTSHFEDQPVSWQVDEIDVNASLTRPDGDGPFPAIVMVAGSGPTDRNWNSPLIPGTNGSAALLAQALTAQGFITLRYDKRASGPKGQENAARLMGKIQLARPSRRSGRRSGTTCRSRGRRRTPHFWVDQQ